MFRRILVAVDGSESGFHALHQATILARAEKGAIKIISVAPPYAGELSLVGVRQHVNEMIIAPHQKALDEALRISEPYGVPVRTILEIGEPPDKIVETAEETHSDLIVVGVRGDNPAKTLLMGSIAARVIGFSEVDVLAVPSKSGINLERILVAVDGSRSAERAASVALQLSESYGSALFVLSVANIPPHLYGLDLKVANRMLAEARQVLDQFKNRPHYQETHVPVDLMLREGEPAQCINQVAADKKVGMIIIGSHGRTGLKRLLMGSVAERVLGHAPCPVLVTKS
jgi:nucleotide-binding universal stress UspA family protein